MKNKIEYPYVCNLQVSNIFNRNIDIILYSGITIFVGPNGVGKTQTLKALRDYWKKR